MESPANRSPSKLRRPQRPRIIGIDINSNRMKQLVQHGHFIIIFVLKIKSNVTKTMKIKEQSFIGCLFP